MPFAAALGIGKIAAPFLGALFGGGAPKFEDLTQNTQDTSNMVTGAMRQAQDLRGSNIERSQKLGGIDRKNARSVGGFDPRMMAQGLAADPGNPFAHLTGIAEQFGDVDWGANALRKQFDRENQLIQLTQQIASLAPSMNLGIDQLLANAGAQAGGGWGSAVGGAIAGLGNEATLGTGLGGWLSGLGGEQVLNAPGASDISGLMSQVPGAITGAPGAGFNNTSTYSPLIQSILQGIPAVTEPSNQGFG